MTVDGLPEAARLDHSALISLRPLALTFANDPSLSVLPGGFAARRKGEGLELADIREYVAGDDIRHLDRAATARTGRLHTRQFREERDRIVLLVADFRSSMFWGLTRVFRSIAAAEILALIGWYVAETGGRVALLAVTNDELFVVPPRPRTRGMLDAIRGLVDAHEHGLSRLLEGAMATETRLDQALLRAERLVPAGAEIVVASGFDAPGADLGMHLDNLARRHTVRLHRVTSAAAEALPRGSYPVRLLDGRRVRLRFGGGTKPKDHENESDIAGHVAAIVDEGEDVETLAARLLSVGAKGRAA